MALFLGAIFATFASFGFLTDIGAMGARSGAGLAYVTLISGSISALYAWCATHRLRWIPVAVLAQIALISAGSQLFPDRTGPVDLAALERRLVMDAVLTIFCLTLGYVLFMMVILREGTRSMMLRAEMALARDIHQSLVPPLDRRMDGIEICGISIPSGDVGGDLVDHVDLPGGRWIGYVADVSGHGVPAGLLMGMVKSSTRTRLQTPATLVELLVDLNRIVIDARRPNMFVTFAAVRATEAGRVEFTLAGHLPIFRLRPGAADVETLSVSQIPLGILESHPFESGTSDWEPGDVLALVTDGLAEVFDREDREFGLDGIRQRLVALAGRPLPEIRDGVLAAVRAHGPQLDDQTLLLIRRVH
jgi:sigma-B regulation protein RsbU (phosphoserine phosphatase)